MGIQLIWENRFNIGVEIIDREHKKLFKIINKLLEFSEQEEKSTWVCREGIKYFKEHAAKHFTEEENYMASISYKGLEMHKRIHEDFRLCTIPALEKELKQTDYSKDAISHFLGVCAGWLVSHTLVEDHAIVENRTGKWENLFSKEEQAAVTHEIERFVGDMFQLESRLVSECYGGEKFGNGIYYRLTYATEDGDQQEFILIFEENLLIRTVGKLIGSRSKQLDVMLMNASRYVARQFIDCIRRSFTDAERYRMEGENLLSYEQFARAFAKHQPQYSLLFDTGAGYFAYCAMSPHIVAGKKRQSLKEERAASEVKEYLSQNHKERSTRKNKILVVDDSEVVRQSMRGLLQDDYQVALANSGLSAFRSITLDRPDLVLLDYNMPLCDGAQVLEMIRSEKEFAAMPVIFLTGREDKTSISKVIPLKPDGYLLKRSKPEEIKRNIDHFFKKLKIETEKQ